jgi:predicted ABC-type ATPase
MAVSRVQFRVLQGGHDIPSTTVVRRFKRSWDNFQSVYQPEADVWWVYDNSLGQPFLIEASE